MRIEWAMACDGVEAEPTGEVRAIGRPIDTTWLSEFPEDFDIHIVMCIVSEDEPDGGDTPRLRCKVLNQRDELVGELDVPATTTVLHYGEWPASWPIRYWSSVVAEWRVDEPLSLGDQQPVTIGHLFLAED